MKMIDLRSDTVTRPTEGMRRAMAAAPVGDDVYGEDPSINTLQERMADLLGKEEGLFVASGTMGNLVALLVHAGRGDEILLGDASHTFLYEAGGSAAVGSIHPHLLPNQPDGTMDLRGLELAIRDPDDVHAPRTRLICLENTHNRCGGIALTKAYCREVRALADRNGLAIHLDGARLFNAAAAIGLSVAELAEEADSVSVCLSKGLGAPVGSVLCGERDFIREAHRMRKLLGGGMRQAGILAAAGLYALDHHVDRLAEDHANARMLAQGIAEIEGLHTLQAQPPERGAWTNLVYFRVDGSAMGKPDMNAITLSAELKTHGVHAHALGSDGTQIRMVTHLDVNAEDIRSALACLRSCVSGT